MRSSVPGQNCILAENLDYATLARRLEPVLLSVLEGDLSRWANVLLNGIQTAAAYSREAEAESVLAMWRQLLSAPPAIAAATPRQTDDEQRARFATRCKVFVLHHDAPPAAPQPYLEMLNLATLDLAPEFQDNRLAENRVYFSESLLATPSDYVGFVTGRWNEKWSRLVPLDRLHRANDLLAPDRVLAALPTQGGEWIESSEATHPGMGKLIEEMARTAGIPLTDRPTFWANNFVCHQRVYRAFVVAWLKLFAHFFARYRFDPPFELGAFDARRKFTYLGERFTMLYFSSRSDLEILPLPSRAAA